MASKKDQRSIERILNKIDRKEQVFEKRTAFMDSDYELCKGAGAQRL